MKVPMKTAASFVGVLAVLGLALLLAPAAQSQQTQPPEKGEKESANSAPFFQDDIKVKPRGKTVEEGWEWTCGGAKCKDGSELFLRNDLFFKINFFEADPPDSSTGESKLEAVRFTIPVVIEVKRSAAGDAKFLWFMNGKKMLRAGFDKCTHGTDDCEKDGKPGSGIPVSWLNGIQNIEVMYKNTDKYVNLGEGCTVHLQGKH
jgi:hypothetical protein